MLILRQSGVGRGTEGFGIRGWWGRIFLPLLVVFIGEPWTMVHWLSWFMLPFTQASRIIHTGSEVHDYGSRIPDKKFWILHSGLRIRHLQSWNLDSRFSSTLDPGRRIFAPGNRYTTFKVFQPPPIDMQSVLSTFRLIRFDGTVFIGSPNTCLHLS